LLIFAVIFALLRHLIFAPFDLCYYAREMRAAFALAAVLAIPAPATVRLQIRVFDGREEVTADTRVTLYKAGAHDAPVAASSPRAAFDTSVPAGLYDAQVIRTRDSRVVNIRWAERLVVMPYPDEAGTHLEAINFQSEFGALEVKGRSASTPRAALYEAGSRDREAAQPLAGDGYLLFVVPAARYDLRVDSGGEVSWHAGIDVPRDRTRFWIVP